MNRDEIIKDWLIEHGLNGLVNTYEACACHLSDLVPCLEVSENCRAAKLERIKHCNIEDCEWNGCEHWHEIKK